MFTIADRSDLKGQDFWSALATDLDHLLGNDDHPLTILANTSAFLFHSLDNINWCGFYLFDGKKLFLAPFGGKPACTEILLGNGVCGTAAIKKQTIVVDDVDLFPGHIVCDSASKSEIVLPLLKSDGALFGVLDIDSPLPSRFDDTDTKGLEQIRDILVGKLFWGNRNHIQIL